MRGGLETRNKMIRMITVSTQMKKMTSLPLILKKSHRKNQAKRWRSKKRLPTNTSQFRKPWTCKSTMTLSSSKKLTRR